MLDIIFGIILLVASVFLIVAVLLQSGKAEAGLSGAIAGGSETFFGKEKGKTMDKMLSKLTTIVAIIFVILVIVVYVIQPDAVSANTDTNTPAVTTAADETTAPAEDTTAAAEDTTAAQETEAPADTTAEAAEDTTAAEAE